MVRFIGLDISTKLGLCIIEVSELDKCWDVIRAIEIAPKLGTGRFKNYQRAEEIAYQVWVEIDGACIDLALIENFAYGNHYTLSMLTEITTLVKHNLWDLDIPFLTIAPTALKKFITNNGKADKSQMAKMCFERYGFGHSSDNVTDAFALAQVLVEVYNGANVNDLNRALLDNVMENRYNAV